MWIDLFHMREGCVPCKCSSQGDLHRKKWIIKWTGWLSLDSSQPLSPVTHVIAQWTLEQSGHGGRDEGYAWVGSATWTSTHQGWPGHGHFWVSNLPAAETNAKPLIWNHPCGWLASDLVAGWFHWTASIREAFVLTGIGSYAEYRFAFPTYDISANTTICGLTECLIHCQGVLQPRNSLHRPRSVATDTCSWDFLVFPCSSTFWSNWLDRTVEWPLEDTLIIPARQQYLAGLGQGSPEVCICSKSASTIYGAICFIARIHRSGDQGMETRMVLLTVTPYDPQAKCWLPVFNSLCSAGLLALAPEEGKLLPGGTTWYSITL